MARRSHDGNTWLGVDSLYGSLARSEFPITLAREQQVINHLVLQNQGWALFSASPI